MKSQAPAPPPPSSWLKDPPAWAGLAARVLGGAVLIVAGTLKAAAPAEEFAVVIEAYHLVSPDAALSLATFMPWAELLVGYSLIFGYLTRPAAIAAALLQLSFIGALAWTKAQGIELPNCGCFGAGWHPSPGTTMALDAVLTVLAYVSLRSGSSLLSLDNWVGRKA